MFREVERCIEHFVNDEETIVHFDNLTDFNPDERVTIQNNRKSSIKIEIAQLELELIDCRVGSQEEKAILETIKELKKQLESI